MDMKIEAMIELLISQGEISREEVENKIKEYRKTSPVVDLENLAMVEAMQMQMIDNLGMMVSILMDRVTELEANANA